MSLADWLLTLFLLFIWIAWIWLVVSILIDIFRSDDLSGWRKAGWTVLVVFATWLGVLIYLIVRGRGMNQRRVAHAVQLRQAQDDYIRRVPPRNSTDSAAEQIARLADLRDRGILTDQEFQAQKAKLLA
jgi:hypothetical protein